MMEHDNINIVVDVLTIRATINERNKRKKAVLIQICDITNRK